MNDSAATLLALNQQVERYQQVLQVMPVAVILLDEKGVISEAQITNIDRFQYMYKRCYVLM